MSLLGLDVGGSNCKAVAFDDQGRRLASASIEYAPVRPSPGRLEFDLEIQWRALCQAVRQVASSDPVRRDPVTALGISAAGDAVVPVDRQGRPLDNSIAVPDPRGGEWVPWWQERLGSGRIFEITGQTLDGFRVANRILWYRAAQPDIYAQTWKFLCWEDFFLARMGLTPAISHSMASRTMMFDIRRQAWSEEMLGVMDLDADRLAAPVPSGTAVGRLPAAIADELCLSTDIAVTTGGYDSVCATLGAGALISGEACLCTGSAEVVVAVTDHIPDANALAARNLSVGCHAVPGLWTVVGLSFAAGTLLRWYRDELGADERARAAATGRSEYEVIAQGVPDEPTDLLVLPHFAGSFSPIRDANSKGAILGLSLSTKRAELLRALLEGTALETGLIVNALAQCGLAIQNLRNVGGGTRSEPWLRIKADVLDREIAVMAEREAGCLAGAILAASATGVHPSIAAATQAMTQVDRFVRPRHAAAYEVRRGIYDRLYSTVAPIHLALAQIEAST